MNTHNTPAILNFDNFDLEAHIRVVMQDDEPWFVAKDVCHNLGLTNASMAVNGNKETGDLGLEEDEKGIRITDTPGGKQKLLCVSESGLYALIFKSRKPEARAFRKWVTSEVLPAIRRHGRYDAAELARTLPPVARRALLMHEVAEMEAKILMLRRQADLCLVIPGNYTVWQWQLMQGWEPPKGGVLGNLSSQCLRLSIERGQPVGEAKVVEHCGQVTRLSRTAKTYTPEILTEVIGTAA